MNAYIGNRPEFFTAGGTLHRDAPSYVPRPADDQLRRLALEGQLCYVLTTRQMGKSSLMVRTARHLQEQGARTAIIDLTSIGTAKLEAWLLSILSTLHSQLKLKVDLESWWDEQARLSDIRRFTMFVQELIPAEVKAPVVIFFDEVDAALRLPYSDDFFSAIRAIYQHGTIQDAGLPVSFVLLGVATPNDLIKDAIRTPFNVGHRIPLSELRLGDAEKVMIHGLPDNGPEILRRIFHWTAGHPYLTQRVGQAIFRSGKEEWTADDVDELVEELFLTKQAIVDDFNLQFVGNRLLASPQKRALLKLYGRLRAGRDIICDNRSQLHNELRLYGLAGVDDNGYLRVRNRIYHQVFDQVWIREHMPGNRWRIPALAGLATALLTLALLLAYLLLRSPPEDVRAAIYIENFTTTSSAAVRVDNLAGLLELEQPEFRDQARRLFLSLRPAEQTALFDRELDLALEQQQVISGTYTTLAVERFTTATSSSQLLRAMAGALEGATEVPGEAIQSEISVWLDGRERALAGDHETALALYESAIKLNENNPALRLEKAMVTFSLQDYASSVAAVEAVADMGPLWEDRARTVVRSDTRWVAEMERAGRSALAARLTAVPTPVPTSSSSSGGTFLQELLTLFSPAAFVVASTPTDMAGPILATPPLIAVSPTRAAAATSPGTARPVESTQPSTRPATAGFTPWPTAPGSTPTATSLPPTPTYTPLEIVQTTLGLTEAGSELTAFQLGSGSKKVVIVGGLHAGFAPATVSLADRLLAYFLDNPEVLPADVTLIVVPNANPDSVHAPGETVGRLNANGVDLNRNWGCYWSPEATTARGEPVSPGEVAYSEPETRALRDFLLDTRPDVVIVYGARASGGLVTPGDCGERHVNSGSYASLFRLASGYNFSPAVTDEIVTGDITNTLVAEDIAAFFVLLTQYEVLSDEEFMSNLSGLVNVMNNLR